MDTLFLFIFGLFVILAGVFLVTGIINVMKIGAALKRQSLKPTQRHVFGKSKIDLEALFQKEGFQWN